MADERIGVVTETPRLVVRPLDRADAAFLVEMLNQPSWLQFIGDRGVRSVADAERYIENGPQRTRRQYGYAINVVQLREEGVPIGVCGLVKRDWLPEPDLGFALLEGFWGRGYAFEAASAVVSHATTVLALPGLLAVTSIDNVRSDRLLGKLRFRFERLIRASPESEELKLYAADLRGHG